MVIWELPRPLPGSAHRYKYRLYFGTAQRSFVRYDNERGKGDHRHVLEREQGYEFRSIRRLIADFRADVENWGSS